MAVDTPTWTIGVTPDAHHPVDSLLTDVVALCGGTLIPWDKPEPWQCGEGWISTPRAGNQRLHWWASMDVPGDDDLIGGCPVVLDVSAQSLMRAREVAFGIADALEARGWTVARDYEDFANLDPDRPDSSINPRNYAVWPYSLMGGVLLFDESAD